MWSKVLPGSGTAYAMTFRPSMLTQAPFSEGRLLPNDGTDFNVMLRYCLCLVLAGSTHSKNPAAVIETLNGWFGDTILCGSSRQNWSFNYSLKGSFERLLRTLESHRMTTTGTSKVRSRRYVRGAPPPLARSECPSEFDSSDDSIAVIQNVTDLQSGDRHIFF